jgi:replicative DNA helicase
MTTQEFEKVIIKALYANQSICSKVLPELTDKWFSEYDTKQIVNKIIEFNTKYSNLPNAIELKRMITDEKTLKVFDDVLAIDDNQVNTPYLMGEIEEFVRKKLLLNQATKIQQYANGGVQKESFTDNIADAEAFTFDDNIGFDFFTEAQRLYEDANTKEVIFKSGLKTLDDLIGGGFHEKSLSLIMSSTNVGKTLIMCALTTNFVLHGYRVLYVTFEDSENKIATRIAQNMFDITQSQYKVMSRDDFAKAFTKAKSIAGGDKLIIKEYPEGTVNALQIEALIKDLKDKKKFVPDVLVVDYIGCMIPNGKPNPNLNSNSLLTLAAQQIRALGMKYGFPVISASQTNRGGYNTAEISLSDAADSFGQNMKADAVFAVTQTPEMKDQGMYQVQLLKTRYGNQRGQLVTIGVDVEKQRIYDLNNSASVAARTQNIVDTNPTNYQALGSNPFSTITPPASGSSVSGKDLSDLNSSVF